MPEYLKAEMNFKSPAIYFFTSVLLCSCKEEPGSRAKAIIIKAPGAQEIMNDNDVKKLLEERSIEIKSSTTGFVGEEDINPDLPVYADLEKLGFRKSRFLVNTKWATIRYLGDAPAGAGLTGDALNKAQLNAFGKVNDTIPVVTTANTINSMLEEFFIPLLKSIPNGEERSKNIRVQGVYYSPSFKNADGSNLARDNAEVVGLQSMYIYPTKCFDEGMKDECKNTLSAGHDPTVVGHELGHVIFNHLRKQKSLDGFQWASVNEAYADYFSASYFSEPRVGRIWMRGTKDHYLRCLLFKPTTESKEALETAHKFSVVWSSTLWRIRERLLKEKKISFKDTDRMALLSIVFLGETGKPRLGDASSALLTAADTLGLAAAKPIMLGEFKNANISLKESELFILNSQKKNLPDVSKSGSGCGVIGSSSSKAVSMLFLAIPLFLFIFSKMPLKFLLLLVFFVVGGCKNNDSELILPPGPSVVYTFSQNLWRQVVPVPSNEIYFSWLPVDKSATTSQILVSDSSFDRTPSAIVVFVDKERKIIDQVRTRDGKAFSVDMGTRYINRETASSQNYIKLATLILEKAVQAMQTASKNDGSSIFEYAGDLYVVKFDPLNIEGYGPLPKEILKNNVSVIRFNGTRSPK